MWLLLGGSNWKGELPANDSCLSNLQVLKLATDSQEHVNEGRSTPWSICHNLEYPGVRNGEGDFLVVQWLRIRLLDFPGGAVVKNPPVNARDPGLIPGPGRSHMQWSN